MSPRRFRILVCRGPECGDKRGSASLYRHLQAAIAARGLETAVALEWQSCFGRCTQGPNVMVFEVVSAPAVALPRLGLATLPMPRGGLSALYNHVTAADLAEILDEHVIRGKLVRRLIERPGAPGPAKGDS